MACQRVAGYTVVHVEAIHAVLGGVISLGVIDQRTHQLQLTAGNVVEDGLHHESCVVREHLARHSHAGSHVEVVALHLDIGGLGRYLVLDDFGSNHHLTQGDVLFFHLDFHKLMVLHLDIHALGTYHTELESSAQVYVEGETAVYIGGGIGALHMGIGDIDAYQGFLVRLRYHPTGDTYRLLC